MQIYLAKPMNGYSLKIAFYFIVTRSFIPKDPESLD